MPIKTLTDNYRCLYSRYKCSHEYWYVKDVICMISTILVEYTTNHDCVISKLVL